MKIESATVSVRRLRLQKARRQSIKRFAEWQGRVQLPRSQSLARLVRLLAREA